MNYIEELRNKMIAAMKSGEKRKKEIYSFLLAEVKKAEKDCKAEFTEEMALKVLRKEQKGLISLLDIVTSEEAKADTNLQLEVLSDLLPKPFSEEEINLIVKETLAEMGMESFSIKEKGKVMKLLTAKIQGRADGKIINKILMSYIDK